MKQLSRFFIGFLAGAALLAIGVAIFFGGRLFPTDRPESQKPKVSEEERFFDLRDRSEVLISIFDDGFQPANIIVKKGTKLIWKNESSGINYPVGSFIPNSKELKLNQLFYYTPTKPGVYNYNSGVYGDKMKGKITVE